MYIVPDLLELKCPRIHRGYFSAKGYSREDHLKILSNWICCELFIKNRSWQSVCRELELEEGNSLEAYFLEATGFHPQEFVDFWRHRIYL